MGNVYALPGGKIPIDQVLDGAKDKNLKEVVVIGIDQDGESYLAASEGKLSNIYYLLSKIQSKIMNDDYIE